MSLNSNSWTSTGRTSPAWIMNAWPDGHKVLRVLCGLFLLPHVPSKFADGTLSAGTVAFFAKAGLHPAELWVALAAGSEIAIGVALVLGICTRWAALGAVFLMAMAVFALQSVKGFGWFWNTGGYEYPVFWGIASLCVALTEFKRRSGRVCAA